MKYISIFFVVAIVGCASAPVKVTGNSEGDRKIASEDEKEEPFQQPGGRGFVWCDCKSVDGKYEVIVENDQTNGSERVATVLESGKIIYSANVVPYNDGYLDSEVSHFNLRLNPDSLPNFKVEGARAYLKTDLGYNPALADIEGDLRTLELKNMRCSDHFVKRKIPSHKENRNR